MRISREEIRKGEKGFNTSKALENYVINKSRNGNAFIITFIFDLAVILEYKRPSDIPADYIPMAFNEAIYHKGDKKTFSKAKLLKYQNSGFNADR